MKRWNFAHVALVTLSVVILTVGVVLVIGLSLDHVVQYSCPAGHDLYARACADAQNECSKDHGAGGVNADGAGFSYGAECQDGVMTSFTFE
jgi:hypothetical protein